MGLTDFILFADVIVSAGVIFSLLTIYEGAGS
jgi:hypothetical protein